MPLIAKTTLRLEAVILLLPALCLGLPFHYFDPTDTAAVPKLLSQTGAYNNTVTKVVDTAAKYYEVNVPLWSDEAAKSRWVILPPGKHIPYNDTTDFFDYPDSTVFMKTFKLDKIQGDSTPGVSRVYWETRFFIKKNDTTINHKNWYGISYRWNADQSDANLVSIQNGFDTVFQYTTSQNRQTYKKWHFPSQQECFICHRIGYTNLGFSDTAPYYARSVLGFYPAQLKRPSSLTANLNQVLDLFNRGVFSGTPPDSLVLARCYKSVYQPIAGDLSPLDRFKTIDTMARSYLGANCSGCHGHRGDAVGAEAQVYLIYDYYNLKPQMELGMHHVLPVGLSDAASDTTWPYQLPQGRNYYRMALAQWGIDTDSGQTYDMALPVGADTSEVLIYPGFPSRSEILYRQWSRNSAWTDSAAVANVLKDSLFQGDSAAVQQRSWIFSQPWGSQAWFDLLNQHQVDINSFMTPADGSYNLYNWTGEQMPPFATYIPDTAALKVLGEWIKNYRTLAVVDSQNIVNSVRQSGQLHLAEPVLRNHTLFVPVDWGSGATMWNIQGQSHALQALGVGAYALPPGTPVGIYMFRVGAHTFIQSLL